MRTSHSIVTGGPYATLTVSLYSRDVNRIDVLWFCMCMYSTFNSSSNQVAWMSRQSRDQHLHPGLREECRHTGWGMYVGETTFRCLLELWIFIVSRDFIIGIEIRIEWNIWLNTWSSSLVFFNFKFLSSAIFLYITLFHYSYLHISLIILTIMLF